MNYTDNFNLISHSPAEHLLLTPKKLHKCVNCKRAFESRRGLNIHLKKCGIVAKWFACRFESCPFKAKTSGGLKNHENKCKNGRPDNQDLQSQLDYLKGAEE